MNRSAETALMCIFYIIVAIYLVDCAFDAIANLELLGASMLFTPSFSVSQLVRKDRRYSGSDRLRNYVGLHTPIHRVLNHAQKFILDRRISRDFDIHTNRGQQKWIYREGVLNIRLDRGYSAVSIGARTIFAVDEWNRTIYHIDASGRLAVTDYHQNYDVSDVITQVSEALEVIAEHYDADKHDAMERRYEWQLDCTENIEGVRDYERATVKCWFVKASNKSVEWRKQWMRETPSGSTQWKITKGSHPTAYQVVIGSTAYWLPHSILSREWELHGGRKFKSSGEVAFFGWTGTIDTIDVPTWWLEKNIGDDWVESTEPIARHQFFKKFINRKRRWAR
jgi:hypothetical protein